jgi:hypothetical protein
VISWAASDVYGQRIALGPVQSRVLDAAMSMTADGRRPELTLGRLSGIVGAPLSSVHDALRRLRALGLLGVSARMGRRGGHRLWRVTRRSERELDPIRHRQAIARLVGRFGSRLATIQAREDVAVPSDGPPEPTAAPLPPGGAAVNHESGTDLPGSSAHVDLDPFLGTPMPPRPVVSPPPDGETFGQKLRRYGLGSWIDERSHR